jgi:hypothetical protein
MVGAVSLLNTDIINRDAFTKPGQLTLLARLDLQGTGVATLTRCED